MKANFFGQFLINKGIISQPQSLLALKIQHNQHVLLGQLAIEENILNAAQVKDINIFQRSQNKCFGQIANELGLISQVQLTKLLDIQKTRNHRIGEILVDQNLMTIEELNSQLQLHQKDCTDALVNLQKAVSLHPLKSIFSNTIDICNSLFLRVLHSKCHARNLVNPVKEDTTFQYTSHILIYTENPTKIALTCSEDSLVNIACAFVDMEPEEMDKELAQDVLGEFLNILLGQLLEAIHKDYGDLERSVPYQSSVINDLITSSEHFLVVHMTSQLGDFTLLVLDEPNQPKSV